MQAGRSALGTNRDGRAGPNLYCLLYVYPTRAHVSPLQLQRGQCCGVEGKHCRDGSEFDLFSPQDGAIVRGADGLQDRDKREYITLAI